MRYLFLAMLLLVSSQAFAQINYVRNPNFEQYSACPTGYDLINYSTGWSALDSPLVTTGGCYPEYLHTCGTGAASVPTNFYFWQYPKSGKGMAQVLTFFDELFPAPNNLRRDYLQGRLYKRLTAGKRYCITFWVCYEEGSSYAIKELSAYLDNGSIDTTKTCDQPQTKYVPQLTNSSGIITDTMNWTKIEGSFTADGTEQFITIGNFRDKANTTWAYTPVDKSRLYDSSAYGLYLIDDVSVIESNIVADAGPDTHVGKGDSVFIGRTPEVGLECSWNILGTSTAIGTGAGIWVKPNITTSYVVTQTLCGVVTKDTVKVEVWAAGLQSVNGQTQQYGIVPNPNNGSFELTQSIAADEQVSISILIRLARRFTLQSPLSGLAGQA